MRALSYKYSFFDCHDTINDLQKLLRLLRGQLAYDLR